MSDTVLNAKTTLPTDDVVARAVQFFATISWMPTSQSARTATFAGKPPIPWLYVIATIIGFICCILPGVIMYVMVIRKVTRFQNLVVSASTIPEGSEVVVRCPPHATDLAKRFLDSLPAFPDTLA